MTRTTRFALVLASTLVMVGCVAGDEVDELEGDFEVSDDDLAADDEFNQVTMDDKSDGQTLSYVAVARLAKAAGLSCTGERIAIATAVAKAESGFRPWITNTVGNAHGIDRGLWQINSYWHPNISATCAFSPSCNARAMASISSKGTKWSPWWTYVNRKHVPFMASARAAQNTVCSE